MSRWFAIVLILSTGAASVPASAVSLYDEDSYRSLTSDRRARRPGELLTVLVFETSAASSSADTTTAKQGGPGIALDSNFTPARSAKLSLTEDFAGRGQSNRSGRLAAQLTVTVRSVDPNGDLLVSGEQHLRVNNEKQEIVLSGRVRQIDIADNNTIASSRLADAKIEYVGDGVLSEKARPGVVSRVLSWLGIL